MQLETAFRPHRVGLILGLIAVCLALQSLVVEYVEILVANRNVSRSFLLAIDLFSVNSEQTIPTWYSAINLFVASVLLWLTAAAKRSSQDRFARYWTGLAVGFLYLSLDEGIVIHEVLADWLQRRFQLGGYLTFAWQIVAVPLVMLCALLYLRFLLHLPPRTRNLFLVAGALYLGGALLLDAVSANQWDMDGAITFGYLAIGTLEELFEMLGVIVLIYAVLAYAAEMRYAFVLRPLLDAAIEPPDAVTRGREQTGRFRLPVRRSGVLAGVVLVVAMNVALLSWASGLDSAPVQTTRDQVPVSLSALIERLATDGVVLMHLPGRFLDNPASYPAVASLLSLYDGVMVVSSVSTDSSLVLAADVLPFDRHQLVEVLHAGGEAQFMIFDTAAVRAIVGGSLTDPQ